MGARTTLEAQPLPVASLKTERQREKERLWLHYSSIPVFCQGLPLAKPTQKMEGKRLWEL